MTALDWAVVGGYFALILGLAWWVILQSKDTAVRLLPRRPPSGLVHHRCVDLRLEHRLGAPGRPGRHGRDRRRDLSPTTNCTPGACWCSAGCWCRSTSGRKCSRCRSSSSGDSRPRRGWLLSLISLVAYVITKIAVGIFAGGVVFRTLLPDVGFHLGGRYIDSFWIGSITGRLAHRPVHRARRHARRGLHRGNADGHPDARLGAGDLFWVSRRWAAGTCSASTLRLRDFNLWEPLLPEGVEASGRRSSRTPPANRRASLVL